MYQLIASFLRQGFTALIGIMAVPTIVAASGTQNFTDYLYFYSLSMIAVLAASGLSLHLSSTFQDKMNAALNLLKFIIITNFVCLGVLVFIGGDYYLIPLIILTFILSEAGKGCSISQYRFHLFQGLNLISKLIVLLSFFAIVELFPEYEITESHIVLILMFPALVVFLVFVRKPILNSKRLYFPIDYYFSNGKLLFSRVISGSQEHILKLILMNIYSPDIISVYEFIMRLCKQSKAVIDNVLSFMVRDFEKRKSFYLRYLLGTILLFSMYYSTLPQNWVIR